MPHHEHDTCEWQHDPSLDEWRGSLDGRPTFYSKTLFRAFGCKICIHKFVAADDEGCFHTHPATAVRIILKGGYTEQLERGGYFYWFPGDIGIVRPDLSHRTAGLMLGNSYSLWIRGQITHKVELRGAGWERQR